MDTRSIEKENIDGAQWIQKLVFFCAVWRSATPRQILLPPLQNKNFGADIIELRCLRIMAVLYSTTVRDQPH